MSPPGRWDGRTVGKSPHLAGHSIQPLRTLSCPLYSQPFVREGTDMSRRDMGRVLASLDNTNLIQHLNEEHKMMNIKELEFQTFEEFMSWKSTEEETLSTSYVQQCGVRTSNTAKVWYYYTLQRGRQIQGSCAWHIDRSWRTALRENVKSNEDQADIYYHLRTLLQENNEPKFRVMLQKFLTYLESKSDVYFKYFKENYCSVTRIKLWASCYRDGCTVNTNMFLESFHRVLKIVYLNHKQNRRVDSLLTTLIKIARDKAFERFCKEEKGKKYSSCL